MAESSSSPSTVRSRLAQPATVVLVLPLLVALAGGLTGWIGYRNVAASARAMAQDGVVEAAHQVSGLCTTLADEATNLSLHLATTVAAKGMARDLDRWAPALADCFAARPSLTWLSVSYPDGTFIGMTKEEETLTFVIQDQEDGGRRRDWQWREGIFEPQGVRTQTGYDARQRPFYRLAVESGASGWTAPYRFFSTGLTGVSLGRPVYARDGTLLAVTSIDYTIDGISAIMDRLAGTLSDRILIHDHTGTVVADAGVAAEGARFAHKELLHLSDLRDDLAVAYASAPLATGTRTIPDGREVHVASMPVTSGDLPWNVAVITDLAPRLRVARAYLLRSVLFTGLVVLIAGGLGVLYARHLVRMRGMVRKARAAAAAAQAEAAEFGSYVLERRLGVGGMGEVWRARHRLLARPAALKLIKRTAEHADDASVVARFEQEARLTAALTSLHTVTVFDFGHLDDGTCYYVMELLEGDDLDGFLKRQGFLPPEAVVHVLLQICDSLHEAHEAGLVHRDLKPANIFIARLGGDDSVVKVLDFGLVALAGAKRTPASGDRLTMAGFVQGTPGFMAPEQLRDEPLDRRADIYALGCVAFWLLTGRAVFVAGNLMEELRQHLDQEAPEPATVARQPIPPLLNRLVHACLARDPAQRPASAEVLAAEVRACGIAPAFPTRLWDGRAAAQTAAVVIDPPQHLRLKGRPRPPDIRPDFRPSVAALPSAEP